MPEIRGSIDIARSADEVWKVVADFGAVADWWPGASGSRMESDDVRAVEMGPDLTILERMVSCDAEARILQYEVTESPFPIESYLATVTVEARGDEATVTLVQAIEPPEMAEAIKPLNEAGLQGLKEHCERG